MKMDGTQLLINDSKIIDLQNFNHIDFKFRNELSFTGHKHHMNSKDEPEFLHIESRISDPIYENQKVFTDYEKYHILAYAIKCVVNMIPMPLISNYFDRQFIANRLEQDLYQPRELLLG